MPKLTSDENGLGSVYIIAIIVVVLAIAGVGIWQLTKKSSTKNSVSSSTSTNSPAVSSACLKLYNDKTLCAFANHTNIKDIAYVATGTSSSSAGGQSNFTVQNDGKGNTSIVMTSDGKQISAINLDGSTYIQSSSSGVWLEYSAANLGSAAVTNPTSGFNLTFDNSAVKGVTVSKVGTVTCGSSNCYKYQVKVSTLPTATQYVLFDTKNYQLKEWIYSDSATGNSSDLSFSYQPVNIVKPSPIQQLP